MFITHLLEFLAHFQELYFPIVHKFLVVLLQVVYQVQEGVQVLVQPRVRVLLSPLKYFNKNYWTIPYSYLEDLKSTTENEALLL